MKVKEILSANLDTRIECIPHYVPYPKQIVKSSGYSNFFLYAGALGMHKGVLDLLEAFRRYSNKISARLIIVGRGPLENHVMRFVVRHNLQGKVVLLGWIDKEMLWSMYRDALALVVPSLNQDPAPTVIMETLSVGTPAIGSDRGGIPEIISKLDKGLIFHGGDVDGLGRILMNYKKEDYPPQKVGEVCQRWFSAENYVSRYLEIIRSEMANDEG
jgi:glycosyltransferase involved in cell wall biosynthesis